MNRLVLTWHERLLRELDVDKCSNYADQIFPEIYQQIYSVEDGVRDYKQALDAKNADTKRKSAIFFNKEKNTFTLQVFDLSAKTSLSELMPILQNLDLYVLSESDFKIKLDQEFIFIHNFECQLPVNFNSKDGHRLCEGFLNIWNGCSENDPLNALIFKSKLTSHDVAILRGIVRAMRQMQLSVSIDYMATILLMYPVIAHTVIDYFKIRFDPSLKINREKQLTACERRLNASFQSIVRSDHDRMIRQLLMVIKACVRTNVYQKKAYLSFKFRSERIPNLPKPLPLYEVFVYAPFVEGVHIRFGKVARGGIRWSDRLEDFRQEVLGLAKTQMIKNSIIVPLGAKGGFVSRLYEDMLQQGASADDLKQEILRCYQTFIRGLLDITDNQKGSVCLPPDNVIRYDDDDPYLVVAADKGTANFSDCANAISQEYGFWLDDAFASGGSIGYDHKKMAITSRGSWISVQTHFSNLGIDCQTTPFTVVGVGDMAGDVFGNGMLMSDKTRLIGAFNHQNIFIDPNPDDTLSFKERQRLFDLSNSTWADYDVRLISKGGGVFKRDAKVIPVSKEMSIAFDISLDITEISPEFLIQHMLKARTDLLWFGGIGTYVRSSAESDFDVHDTHNDLLRISANQLRCRIIGEGANLAMTQKARIEYALLGGYLNTDAIDNSAGVSCSDHEVNIKILFGNMMQAQLITRVERDILLPKMTENIAELVLNDNVKQNYVLTWLEKHSQNDINMYKNLINILENNKNLPLNRKLESLPTDQEIDRRIHDQRGLTRPELSVLLAYSKIIFFQRFLSSHIVVSEEYQEILLNYFPSILQKRFSNGILNHQLSREIVATILSNELMNRMGPVDVFETLDIHDNDMCEAIKAYLFVRNLFGPHLNRLHEENLNYDVVLVIRQLMIVYARNRIMLDRLKRRQFDFKAHLEPWFKRMPKYALVELFELFCQTKSSHIHVDQSVKDATVLANIYKTLAEKLEFFDFSSVAIKLQLHTPWQRKTKMYLLDDWVCLQVKLVKFAHGTKKGQAWIKEILHWGATKGTENLESLQVLSRVQNGGIDNDLGFVAYFIRYFDHVVKTK